MAEDTTTNALGLDFSELSVEDKNPVLESPEALAATDPSQTAPEAPKKEKQPVYYNPERVKTGGVQRDKLSNEALEERMARIREQNEKIKQRRLDVQADEEAFRKTEEADRARQVQARKMQSEIDQARDRNMRRKMDKTQNREWDSAKSSGVPDADDPSQRPNRAGRQKREQGKGRTSSDANGGWGDTPTDWSTADSGPGWADAATAASTIANSPWDAEATTDTTPGWGTEATDATPGWGAEANTDPTPARGNENTTDTTPGLGESATEKTPQWGAEATPDPTPSWGAETTADTTPAWGAEPSVGVDEWPVQDSSTIDWGENWPRGEGAATATPARGRGRGGGRGGGDRGGRGNRGGGRGNRRGDSKPRHEKAPW